MSDRDFWVGAARRLALRRNVAAWVDLFLPVALGLTLAAALALVGVRLLRADTRWVWWCWEGAIGVAAIVAALIAWGRVYRVTDALVRLDEVHGLHDGLTAAEAGIGAWPERKAGAGDAVRWNWVRVGEPVFIGGIILAAAGLVDLPRLVIAAHPTEEPIAWTQLESWLQKLDQAKVLDQPALEKLKEQVDDLRKQPAEDWYSQSSLEAGDDLQKQTAQSLHELEANMQKSSDLIAQAQAAGQTMSDSELQTVSMSLKQAAMGMQAGNLPLNKELAGKLGSFDPSTIRSLTQAQMQAMQQQLKAGTQVCSQCVGANPATGKGMSGDGHRQGKDSHYPSGHPGGAAGGPGAGSYGEN